MISYQDWKYDDQQEQYPNYNYELKSHNKRNNQLSKVLHSSKYTRNPYISSSKKQTNTAIKGKINQNRTSNSQNEKKDYIYSNINQEDESRNSTKYYSQNKYLTLFNSASNRYERSNATLLNDGVLRGYTDNCSFYISGSSNIKPKTTIKNKFLNNNKNNSDTYNRYNKNFKLDNKENSQKKVYESRTQVINPIDYEKKEVQKDKTNKYNQKNDNKYNKKNYNSKTIINTSVYTINNSNYNNDEKNKYKPFNIESQYKNKNKINDEIKKYNYSRKFYANTEPSYNIKNYNTNRSLNIEQNNKPYIPSKKIINLEPKTTIININSNRNYTDNNNKKVYKTSTNTNLEEKNKNHFYQTIVEKKTYENKRRNNTPNISSRLENNNILNNSTHYISAGKRTLDSQNKNNNKSVIPHNTFKYKTNLSIDENVLNKTERNYQPKQTIERKNSNSNKNSNLNKNRYNFPEKPRLREYGTKTEVHSFSDNKYSREYFNNNEKGKINDIPKNKNKETKNKNYIVDIKKIEPKKEEKNKNRYAPRSFSITPAIRSGRKYGVQTENTTFNRDRNYIRNNEYEVTNITSLKNNQEQKDKYSLNKNIPKVEKPNIKDNKTSNNMKKNSVFERSLKNIKENEKEIEKEQKSFFINRDSRSNNQTIFISDFSKNKKYYRTSTQRPAFRPHGYILGNLSEFEVPAPKYQKYGKKEEIQNIYPDKRKNKNVYNININKNNYFNAMKNLEEEIEVDDDNEQVEYLPPKVLSKLQSKPKESKENKYSYNANKTYKPTVENKTHYTITTITKEDKKNVNKDNKEKNTITKEDKKNINKDYKKRNEIIKEDKNTVNKDKKEGNKNVQSKKNNITQKTNAYKGQNNNNYGYYESSNIKNPKENKFLTIHKSSKLKDNINEKQNENKNEKTNQNRIINITINKPQEQKPKQNTKKNQKYIPKYIIPQHIPQNPIIIQQQKNKIQQIKAQPPQSQQKSQIQPKIQTQLQPKLETQKQNQQKNQIHPKIEIKSQPQKQTPKQNQQKIKSIQIQQPKPVKQVRPQKIQKEQEIKSEYQQKKEISKIKPQKQIETHQLEEEHQEIENNEEINKDNENKKIGENENNEENDDNNLKKSKYASYFGDYNNNYYEIKGVSGSGEKNENEEEEEENEENENENTQKRYEKGIQLVRNITFGIKSENLHVPEHIREDKEEKEADEQIMEEDEQNDINEQEMEENDDDGKKENYEENEEGEVVGDEVINEEDNGNEEYDENENLEGEEFEDNIIEENNYNEEEENNEENEDEEN